MRVIIVGFVISLPFFGEALVSAAGSALAAGGWFLLPATIAGLILAVKRHG